VNTIHTQKRVGVILKSENIQFNDKQMPNDEEFYMFLDFFGFLKLTSSHYTYFINVFSQNFGFCSSSVCTFWIYHSITYIYMYSVTRIFGFFKLINSHYFRKWFHTELCHKLHGFSDFEAYQFAFFRKRFHTELCHNVTDFQVFETVTIFSK
jgi:hypothetical protein